MRRPGVHLHRMADFRLCCNSFATASGLPRWCREPGGLPAAGATQCHPAFDARKPPMPATGNTPPRLPPTFNRLAWSNLAAQSAEQIALAAAPIVAVLLLGVGEGQTGM